MDDCKVDDAEDCCVDDYMAHDFKQARKVSDMNNKLSSICTNTTCSINSKVNKIYPQIISIKATIM